MRAIETAHRLQVIPQKPPKQLAREFEGRKAKVLAKGRTTFRPNIPANAVTKPAARGEPLSRMGEG